MRRGSRRDAVLLSLGTAFIASIITFIVGPAYLEPLPVWLKLLVAAAACLVVAAVAIYGRRRSRRVASAER